MARFSKMVVLAIACLGLMLATLGPGNAQEEGEQFISGVSISMTGAPDVMATGETFTMVVTVSNYSGYAVSGRLRTYLYASIEQVSYPYPDPGFTYVPVAVGEWLPNEIYIVVENNDVQSYLFELTVMPDLIFTKGSTAEAKLRARFRYTGYNVKICPDSDKPVTLYYAAMEQPGLELPFELRATVAGAVMMTAVGAVVYLAVRKREVEEAPYR